MELEKIKGIVEFMRENGLVELSVEDAEGKVSLKREGAAVAAAPAAVPVASAPAASAGRGGETAGETIKSPLVGTFYRSSSPDADPFVKVGSVVGPNTVVCIVEAMKVMNEIKAGVSGKVSKVLLENASPVQYGQPLFLVEPD
ncbi:MAG: acetyl-CoA carboxylase biotin carboxyl carrier protein [Kiritimatiellae bacterium]|nr:acetyl-CoA carboxylase biotin carboxyl carrier protein [Kiritimatiellia bacterium]